jgi:hypothetical protein
MAKIVAKWGKIVAIWCQNSQKWGKIVAKRPKMNLNGIKMVQEWRKFV